MFPGFYDELILAFKAMRAAGVSEADAIGLARDGGKLAGWLYANEYGPLAGPQPRDMATKCALCAKDSAY